MLLLGLVATMPIGAILGSLFSNPSSLGFVFVPMMGLIAISGIFYPITAFPLWLQWIGQVFPIYWMGLGMRSAFLPDSLASVEIDDSWRHLETAGVHYQTVGYLERGEYSPNLHLALKIAEYFEVPVEVIFSTTPFPRIGSGERSA